MWDGERAHVSECDSVSLYFLLFWSIHYLECFSKTAVVMWPPSSSPAKDHSHTRLQINRVVQRQKPCPASLPNSNK